MRIATVALVVLSLAPAAYADRLPVPAERLPPTEPIETLDDPPPPPPETEPPAPPVPPAPPPFDFEGTVPSPSPGSEPKPAVHEQRCGAVTATWRGEHGPSHGADRWDSLVIEVAGRAKPWTQNLRDFAPEARTTELFSPDCRYVLLLTSRSGPYHVIRTERMAAYLDGAKPDYVLDGEKTPLPDGEGVVGAGVFRGGGLAVEHDARVHVGLL